MKIAHLVILIVVIILVIIAIAFCEFYFIRRRPKQQQSTEDTKPPTDVISSFFVPDFKEQLTESVEQNNMWKLIDNKNKLMLCVPEYVKPVPLQNKQQRRMELANMNDDGDVHNYGASDVHNYDVNDTCYDVHNDSVNVTNTNSINEAKTSTTDVKQFILYGEDVF